LEYKQAVPLVPPGLSPSHTRGLVNSKWSDPAFHLQDFEAPGLIRSVSCTVGRCLDDAGSRAVICIGFVLRLSHGLSVFAATILHSRVVSASPLPVECRPPYLGDPLTASTAAPPISARPGLDRSQAVCMVRTSVPHRCAVPDRSSGSVESCTPRRAPQCPSIPRSRASFSSTSDSTERIGDPVEVARGEKQRRVGPAACFPVVRFA